MRVVRAYLRAAKALGAFDLDLWLWHKVRWLKLNTLARWLYLLVVFALRTSFYLTIFLFKFLWRLLVLFLRLLLRFLLRLAVELCLLVYFTILRLAVLIVHLAPAVFWGVADAAVYVASLMMLAARWFTAGVYGVFQRGLGGVVVIALAVSGLYLILSPTWTELYRFNILFHLAVGVLALAIVPRDYFVWLLKNFSALTFLRLFFAPVALTAAVVLLPGAHEKMIRSTLLLAVFALLLFVNSIGLSKKRTGGGGTLETLFIQALMCLWFFEAATGVVIALNYDPGAGWIFKYHRFAAYAFVGLVAARRLAVRRVCECPGCIRGRYARYAVAAALAAVFAADAFVALPQRLSKVYIYDGTLQERQPRSRYFSPSPGPRPGALNVTRSCGEGAGCHAEIVADHLRSPHARSYRAGQSCVFCHSVSGVRVDREKPSESFFTVAVHDRHMSTFLDDRKKPVEPVTHVYFYGRQLSIFLESGTVEEVARVEGRDRRLLLLGRTGHARVFSRRSYKSDEFCVSCHHSQIASTGEEAGRVEGLGRRMIFTGKTNYARVFSRKFSKSDEFCVNCHYHQVVTMNRAGRPYRRPKCVECHMRPRRTLGLEGGGNLKNHIFPGATKLHSADFISDPETEYFNLPGAAGEIRTTVPPGWDYEWDARKYLSEALGRPEWFSIHIELLAGVTPGKEARIRIFTINNGLCHELPAPSFDEREAWLEVIAKDSAGNIFFHSGGMDADFRVDPAAHRLGGVTEAEVGIINNSFPRMPMPATVIMTFEEGRVIPSGQVVTDDFAFEVPEGIEGWISISARWRYRGTNQDFFDMAYPGSGKTALVATVASARLDAHVESSE